MGQYDLMCAVCATGYSFQVGKTNPVCMTDTWMYGIPAYLSWMVDFCLWKISIPGNQITSIFEGQPPQNKAQPNSNHNSRVITQGFLR